VNSWRPIIIQILTAFKEFEDDQFRIIIPKFYTLFVDLLLNEVTADVRLVLHSVLKRCARAFIIEVSGE
jgi:hypothetical protein